LRKNAYTRNLRGSRTIADLADAAQIGRVQMAEALSHRHRLPRA
jgi:magnesium chelatase family protein